MCDPQDKATSHLSCGVEGHTTIFNASFGATRKFVIADLASLGGHLREKVTAYADIVMRSGDLAILPPDINRAYGHGVCQDAGVEGLRVSIAFRHVDKHWVRERAEGGGYWEHCTRSVAGTEGPWQPLPLGDAHLLGRRELCAHKLRAERERREKRGSTDTAKTRGQKKVRMK